MKKLFRFILLLLIIVINILIAINVFAEDDLTLVCKCYKSDLFCWGAEDCGEVIEYGVCGDYDGSCSNSGTVDCTSGIQPECPIIQH